MATSTTLASTMSLERVPSADQLFSPLSIYFEDLMQTTYSVNIQPNRMVITDKAIGMFLNASPAADVEDALDEIFNLGVDAMIARTNPEESTAPNEVCL